MIHNRDSLGMLEILPRFLNKLNLKQKRLPVAGERCLPSIRMSDAIDDRKSKMIRLKSLESFDRDLSARQG